MKNSYFLFLGISFLFISVLDYFHLIVYPGMNIISLSGPNASTQFWISARLMQALSFLIAPRFFKRTLHVYRTIIIYALVTAALLICIIYFRNFPTTYVPGIGMTQFKNAAEVVISVVFATAMVLLSRYRSRLNNSLLLFLKLSFLLTILSEFFFTSYVSIFNMESVIGHLIRLSAYYMFYKAIIEIGLSQPYQLLFLETEELSLRKDEFINIASHEIKNPLTVIKLYAEHLNKNLKPVLDAKNRQALSQIDRQTDVINHMVNDMLDASRITTGKLSVVPAPCYVDEIIKNTVTEMRQIISDHRIVVHIQPHIRLYGDIDRLHQVFTNLIANAAKYSPPGKRIIVTLKQQRSRAIITVQDFGQGIPREHQGHIFEKYYRTPQGEQTAAGLGLGLYLSREIITRHSGRIWLKSTMGKGTTFFISLPIK